MPCRVLAHLYIIYCHTADSKCSYFSASQSVWVNWLFCLLSLHHCSRCCRCCCCVFLCFFILSKLNVQDNGCIFMFPAQKQAIQIARRDIECAIIKVKSISGHNFYADFDYYLREPTTNKKQEVNHGNSSTKINRNNNNQLSVHCR